MRLVFLLLFVLCITVSDASRILVWIPTASISHQVVFRPLTQELARRGHEVVVITTDPAFPKGQAPANLTEIDVHDVSYNMFQIFAELPRGNKEGFFDLMKKLCEVSDDILDAQLNQPIIKNLLNSNQKFDLLILEGIAKPLLALSHVFKAPVIQANSFGPTYYNLDYIGASSHPFLYPSILRQRIVNLTLWEKAKELYNDYRYASMMIDLEPAENAMMRKHFGEDLPPLSELANNVDMLFLNTHPIYEGNRAVPPGVVYMWGIHKKPEKPLPDDLKSYLDNSKHGAIYMSFGSNVDPTKLPPKTIQMFLKVLCQLPHDILFKWDADELPGRCKNIRISRWFPQPDLLRHPKVKLFITQGGLQSTEEALTAGVPLVGIPMLVDQWYNVEKYVQFKIGVKLDVETVTEEDFRNAVTTVLNDESYRQNIKKLDELMRDEPMSALERTVWWVEHLLRHGGARHLRSPAANISWSQYLELELVAVVISAVTVVLIAILLTLYFSLHLLRRIWEKPKKD